MFKKILIANRGEIAVRIHRTCREMGIQTVAVHSEAEADALHVRLANESVCIGPAPVDKSYLNIPAILAAAEITDAEAIHPGYGFLSESAKFAEIVTQLGFTFIGPSAKDIDTMGDKIAAIKFANSAGVPTIPGSGSSIETAAEALTYAKKIGFPVLIKAAAGGGGRGMKIAHSEQALHTAYTVARTESKAAFGDDRVYMEKYLQQPRHIEVQVLCDSHGNVATLGERDCSLQRRHQKVVEETPSPALTDTERDKVFDIAEKACKKLGYLGAGTFEFLYEEGEFYFIEMNTRLQVEHPITEMVTGVDLVAEQIRIAAGEPMTLKNMRMKPRGHSIECRINAEHPEKLIPMPGLVTDYFTPGGLGVRVDSCLYPGYKVPPYYDSNVAKLIVHGKNRTEAVTRMNRALEEYIIAPQVTNIALHRRILATNAFQKGDYNIHSLERFLDGGAL